MKISLRIGGTGAALLLGIVGCATASASPPPSGRLPGLAGSRLTALALVNPGRGYGLFGTEAGSRCAAVSGLTTDGGARFRSASLIITWNCNYGAPVTQIATDGAGDVFAYGPGHLMVSRGAGQWRRSREDGTVLAISAVRRSVWMLLARCRGAAITAHGCGLRLLESADGGRTWHPARSQPPGAVTAGSAAGPASEPAAGQTWLMRAGTSAGYVLASPAVNDRGRADSAALWYTGNSGSSWSERRLPCGIDALSDSAARSPGGALVAVCADQPSAGAQTKTTAISLDGGISWTVHVGCLFKPGCRDPLYSGYLGQIAAVSPRTAYLVGDRTSLLVTTDGGRHWHDVLPYVGDPGNSTYQVTLFGSADGVVIGQGGATGENNDVFRTFDGGRTWSEVTPKLS